MSGPPSGLHIPLPTVMTEFSELYNELYLPLCMYALRITDDRAAAEDVVQNFFARMWERRHESAPDNIKAYAFRAVRNSALLALRDRDRSESVPVDMAGDVAVEDIDTAERDAAIWLAVDRLPRRRRAILLMSKRDGMTYAEIADELGISVKTVENQMTQALASLRQALRGANGSDIFFLPFLTL